MTDSEKIRSLELQLVEAGKALINAEKLGVFCPNDFRCKREKSEMVALAYDSAKQALTPDIQRLMEEDAAREKKWEWRLNNQMEQNAALRKELEVKDGKIKDLRRRFCSVHFEQDDGKNRCYTCQSIISDTLRTQRDALGESLQRVLVWINSYYVPTEIRQHTPHIDAFLKEQELTLSTHFKKEGA